MNASAHKSKQRATPEREQRQPKAELSVKQAAQRIGVDEDEILLAIQTRKLAAENISLGRHPHYRITMEALDKYAKPARRS
jgi:excisionase family DNA binding protein